MATQEAMLPMTGEACRPGDVAPVGWKVMMIELGRLLGLALVLSLAVGLVFTSAAVMMPAS